MKLSQRRGFGLARLREFAKARCVRFPDGQQLVEPEIECAPIEIEATVEGQNRSPQHGHGAQRMMLSILLQGLEAPCYINEARVRLAERKSVLMHAMPGARAS